MLMPSIFGENFFDDFMKPLDNYSMNNMMSTDVKETDQGYELDMELPGFNKEDIQASIKDGYLTIQAVKNENHDEKDESTGRFIRKERYSGACQRSFYVGEQVTQDEIKASFHQGVLKLLVPKKEQRKELHQDNYIAIEG